MTITADTLTIIVAAFAMAGLLVGRIAWLRTNGRTGPRASRPASDASKIDPSPSRRTSS